MDIVDDKKFLSTVGIVLEDL